MQVNATKQLHNFRNRSHFSRDAKRIYEKPYYSPASSGSTTLICISFTKQNIHLLLERVFLSFPGYSLTVAQMQVNATKQLHNFRNRSHFSRDAKRIYEKPYYSPASSVVSTVTLGQWIECANWDAVSQTDTIKVQRTLRSSIFYSLIVGQRAEDVFSICGERRGNQLAIKGAGNYQLMNPVDLKVTFTPG
ncbi:hypothetical protein CSKR_107229 [Clonorchis sinensis]|uniref:Uncharacterized protein n=1 Tax=Clonorchis sinensis TaxID=79923 RepID=A0A3R7D3I9_CLOSI|nr:hypothetical protein CSKR_107229 [Clonorchis sinensis]